MMQPQVSDQQLKNYIDQVFQRYDQNKNGTLNLIQLHNFLNDLFKLSGHPKNVSYEQALDKLHLIDSNKDGLVNKLQLFNVFRALTIPEFKPITISTTKVSLPVLTTVTTTVPLVPVVPVIPVVPIVTTVIPVHTQTIVKTVPVVVPQPITVTTTETTKTSIILDGVDHTWDSNFRGKML